MSPKPALDVETGEIVFVQHFLPPLDAGDYEVSIEQQVTLEDGGGPVDVTYTNTTSFAVQGLRFGLDPRSISAVFPPPNNQGEYNNVLPHLVLTDRSLPWQRSPSSTAPPVGSGEAQVPTWMALLLFAEGDASPPPVAISGTLADLRSNLPADAVSYPNLACEQGQAWTDPVNYIDVPVAIFSQVTPSLSDLDWLAHGRSISTRESKIIDERRDVPVGDYAVVVGNRLPPAGQRSQVYLVSLENLADYLPNSDGTEATGLRDSGASVVRLAVLQGWSFSALDLPMTFGELLTGLDRSPATLQMPRPTAEVPDAVVDSLALGYTAMDHHTRTDGRTVSWYRGPLVPYATTDYVRVPRASADALVRYDPSTGMFDVSYAAAWQLGRLMALNDKEFATSLYDWKRSASLATVAEAERELLTGQPAGLGGQPAGLGASEPITARALVEREVVEPLRALVERVHAAAAGTERASTNEESSS